LDEVFGPSDQVFAGKIEIEVPELAEIHNLPSLEFVAFDIKERIKLNFECIYF